jgi:hypothetical protein
MAAASRVVDRHRGVSLSRTPRVLRDLVTLLFE